MKKKLFAILLCGVMALGLAGCSNPVSDSKKELEDAEKELEETYKKYKQQEAFLSWKEILGDDYSKYEEYMTDDGRLDLEKCPNWEKYNMVYYSPVYAVVMSSSKNLENCIKFLEMMVQ